MQAFKGTSLEGELNKNDWKRWARNLLVFSSPAILAVLVALQSAITNENFLPTRDQLVFALGSAYSAIIAALIDLFQKFKQEKA